MALQRDNDRPSLFMNGLRMALYGFRNSLTTIAVILIAAQARGQLPNCDSSSVVAILCPSVNPNPCTDYEDSLDCPGGLQVIPTNWACPNCFPDLVIPGLWWEIACAGATQDIPFQVAWCHARQVGEPWTDTFCANVVDQQGQFIEQLCSDSYQCIWSMETATCVLTGDFCRHNQALLYDNENCQPPSLTNLRNDRHSASSFATINVSAGDRFRASAARALLSVAGI
jgi:hypothetical protein